MNSDKPVVKLDHIVIFSDAIFAFSITIVLLSIQIPELPNNLNEQQLQAKLWEMIPDFESYAISFAVIAIYWISYHKAFNKITGSHPVMVGLNLLFLFFVTLISLFIMLDIKYGTYSTVFILYASILTLAGSTLAFIWVYAQKIRIVDNELSPVLRKQIFIQMIIAPFVFLISIPISLINVDIAQYFWLTIIPLNLIAKQKTIR
ncbi:MAG: TMEM175 family protein [Nitrososphaeraceae archaeon]|nr:TMEM175 family protein [Nitrososphaeraceae archaeon]